MRILADATLPNINDYCDNFFDLVLYHNQLDLLTHINNADILICRSTLNVNEKLLKSSKLKCVATASSGTDHIDKRYLKLNNIELIDAKGTNAGAVCDYVLATISWLIKEKLIVANKVGIVGVGAVGSKLWRILEFLGFEVKGYDPLKEKRCADFKSCRIEDLYSVDVICIHANLHETQPNPSLNLFNYSLLKKLKRGVVIINASRGDIVNEADLLTIDNVIPQRSIIYCTDVFSDEPNINPDIVSYAKISTPHIAGHSIEAKNNAVRKIFKDLYNIYAPYLLAKEEYFEADSLINYMQSCPVGSRFILQNSKFQEEILGKYNPYYETQIIKLAKDKREAFINLRKNHTFRHDFF